MEACCARADGIPLPVVFTDRIVAVLPKPSTKSARHRPSTKTPTKGRADRARLRRTSDEEIARTAPVELRALPDDFLQEVHVVTPVTKQAISIRLDEDVIDWFSASGPKYQTRINAVLRRFVEQIGAAAPVKRKRRAL